MTNINNPLEKLRIEPKEDELKGKIEELKEERKEIVGEKVEYEPGTMHILNTSLTIIEKNIEKIKQALAELKLSGGTNAIEQEQ